jgi:hypothetical protein
MKKLLVIALAALFTTFAFAETSSPVLILLTTSVKNETYTQTLFDNGLLTATICYGPSRGTNEAKKCVTQSEQLNEQEKAEVLLSMRESQLDLLESVLGSDATSQSSSSGESGGGTSDL